MSKKVKSFPVLLLLVLVVIAVVLSTNNFSLTGLAARNTYSYPTQVLSSFNVKDPNLALSGSRDAASATHGYNLTAGWSEAQSFARKVVQVNAGCFGCPDSPEQRKYVVLVNISCTNVGTINYKLKNFGDCFAGRDSYSTCTLHLVERACGENWLISFIRLRAYGSNIPETGAIKFSWMRIQR